MSKIWDWFNKVFGGGTKAHTNITGVHETMGWNDVKAAVIAGKHVHRWAWSKENPDYDYMWLQMDGEVLMIRLKNGQDKPLKILVQDMVSADWYVCGGVE